MQAVRDRARARGLLSEAEAGAIMSSPVDGAVRLDDGDAVAAHQQRRVQLDGADLAGGAEIDAAVKSFVSSGSAYAE